MSTPSMHLSGRESIRGKLMRVVLITTAAAVLVAGLAMLTRDLTVNRLSWGQDLANQATIIALATTPALAFDDHAAAERYLTALQARPRILTAVLYDSEGRLYASYVKQGERAPAAHVPNVDGVQINGQRVELVQPIVRGSETLGSLYLEGQYDLMSRVTAYIGIFGLVMALSLLVAYLLSKRLQRVITEPLEAMTRAARDIVERRDYASRARKFSGDEFGLVADAFNNMLDEVQARAVAQEQTNRELQQEIVVREAAEAALNIATARLESTMAAAEIGTWSWDIPNNRFLADRNLAALFGVRDEKELHGDPAAHRKRIHVEDLPMVLAAEREAMSSGVLASTEFRVIWADGSEHWMARRGKVQIDADGKAVFLSGVLIDITAQKIAEQALRASETLYRAIGESIDFGVWVVDRGGRSVYTSESFLKLIGRTQAEIAASYWGDFLHPAETESTRSAWQDFLRSGVVWYREVQVLGTDGVYHPILSQGVPIRGEQGEITGWAGINLDISRLKATEAALRDADRRKDEFLATLAHELRNPLTPIRHAVKLLEAGTSTDESQQQWARAVIARQLQRMALMLDDLLEVSRITQGRLELKTEVVDLAAIISTAVETARPLVEAKRQHLRTNLPAHPVTIAVDPLRMSQSISNLLTNAAKYTDPGGHISLSVELMPQEVAISVSDDGIGLEPQAIPRVFDMFSQVKSAIDRSEGGLGIGLALVKGMIQLHGGRVEASSPGTGRGSKFVIYLPNSVLVRIPRDDEARAMEAAARPGARRRVLIADDNRDAADTLALLLEMDGYDTCVAHGGLAALDEIRNSWPDAVILDIGMPDLNGYEVARRIREEARGRGMFLLAITGWGHPDDVARAKTAGFNEHLTKPVDADNVVRLLSAYLAN